MGVGMTDRGFVDNTTPFDEEADLEEEVLKWHHAGERHQNIAKKLGITKKQVHEIVFNEGDTKEIKLQHQPPLELCTRGEEGGSASRSPKPPQLDPIQSMIRETNLKRELPEEAYHNLPYRRRK